MTSLALGRERGLPAGRSAGPTGHPIQVPWSRELKADFPAGLFSGSKTQVNRSQQWCRWAPVFAGAHRDCGPCRSVCGQASGPSAVGLNDHCDLCKPLPPVISEPSSRTGSHTFPRGEPSTAAWTEVPLPLAAVSSGSCIPVIFLETSLPPSCGLWGSGAEPFHLPWPNSLQCDSDQQLIWESV